MINNKKRCLWNIYAPSPLPRKHLQRKCTETANNLNFYKSKVHNSVINCSIVPKVKINLAIIMVNLYTKFNFSKCNLCQENEQENHIIRIFICSRCTTNLRTSRSFPQSNMLNLFTNFHFNICIFCKKMAETANYCILNQKSKLIKN